jgi:O-antigen ligase
MIVGVVLAELALVAAGLLLDQPYLGLVPAAALVYFIVAYRHPSVAWILIWLAFPFSIDVLFPTGHALYMPLEPMIGIALLAWVARLKIDGEFRWPKSALNAPLAALAAATIVSVLFSRYPSYGANALVAATGYVAFGYLLFCLAPPEAGSMRRWVPWVVGSTAFWGLYGLIRVALGGATYHAAYGVGRPFFTEHGGYAAFLAMILPLSLLLTVTRRGRSQAFYAVCSFLIASGILISLTRAAWLSIALVVPPMLALWAWREGGARAIAWAGGVAAVAFLALVGIGAGNLISRHAGTVAETRDVSTLERFNRWMAATAMVRDSPWTGVGFAAYPQAYSQYRRKLLITELAYQRMGPHSEPMRLLAETGVPGFAAACWLLGAAFALGLRVFWRSTDRAERLLSLALIAGLGTYAVHSVFRTYLDLERVAVPFWAALGLLAALAGRLEARAPEARHG